MTCHKCGKEINEDKYDWENYAYKVTGKRGRIYYYCSWTCMRTDKVERPKRRVGDTRWL